ncbi:MAG TPA: DUF6320 domain-containing protein [Chryseosolibacter sp.]
MEDLERHLLQRILWQVTATLLLSGIATTLIIDVARHKTITWSVYPVTICLIAFSYASLFAFWQTKTIYRILGGWVLSSLLLLLVDLFLDRTDWPTGAGIPLVFALNFVAITLLAIFRITKRKGLNLLAYTFVGIAVLCISIEWILSRYFSGKVELAWSIIVAACLFPVSIALLFIFFRTWNNPKLQKIFHT